MKKIQLFVIGLLLSSITFGQVINLQTGVSVSKLDWQAGILDENMFNRPLVRPTILVGLDYFDHTYFNLSSNMGIIQKGGKGEIKLVNELGVDKGTSTITEIFNYYTFNTAIEFKYPIQKKIFPFISIGARADVIFGNHSSFDFDKKNISVYDRDDFDKNRFNYGVNLGGGIKYHFSKLQIGLRSDYYFNFRNIADRPKKDDMGSLKIKDNTFTVNFVVGYKL